MEFDNTPPVGGDLRLRVRGSSRYQLIIRRAFPSLHFSRTFPATPGFDWGVYLKGAGAAEEASLLEFCALLQHALFIEDDLDEDFALAFHTHLSPAGGYPRTEIGQLVYESKPYNLTSSPGSPLKAQELAVPLARFVSTHPTYRRAEVIAAIPPSNPNKPFDLPTFLVQEIAKMTGQTAASSAIRKTRATRPMKDCRTDEEKMDNIAGAFAVDPSTFAGKSVILIDDIYQTGASINEVCRVLRSAGASLVLGLVATKTSSNIT